MKTLNVIGIFAGAAMLTAAPVSLQWSQEGVSLSLDQAQARIGRPATPLSVAGVARRTDRRAYRRAAVYGGVAGIGAYGVGSYYGSYGYPSYSAYGSYRYPTYGYSNYGYPGYGSYASYGYPAGYASGYRYPGYGAYASYGYPGFGVANTWGSSNWGYGSPSYSYAGYGSPRYGWAGYRGAMASAPTYYGSPHFSSYAPNTTMGSYSTMQPSGNFQAYWTQPATTTTSRAAARTR